MSKDLMESIWIQNVGDIDFEVIPTTENSNKFKKTRFSKEKSVEDVVTLGTTAEAHYICYINLILGILESSSTYYPPIKHILRLKIVMQS